MLKYVQNISMQQKMLFIFITVMSLPYLISAQEVKKTQRQKNEITSVKEAPRKDLYRKIKRTAGVSLKEISNLVFQKGNAKINQMTLNKLSKYVNKRGTVSIDKEYQQRMNSIKAFCDRQDRQSSSCYSQIEDLKKEQVSLQKLKNQAKKDKKLALYYNLTILTHAIKTKIFARANEHLAKTCPPQKINSDLCIAKRNGIRNVYDIVDKLKLVASAQIRGKAQKKDKETKKIANHINQLIAFYE